MNKFDKKIINLYIKTNNVSRFVRKKPNNQEILYFAKHSINNDLTSLTDYVLDSNNLNLIVDYAMYAVNMSEKDMEKIVSNICNTNNARYICRLAIYAEYLNEKSINSLTAAIIKTKNYNKMLSFYANVEKLSDINKELIYKAILESKNSRIMTELIIRISSLTDNKIAKLIDAIDCNDISEYKRIQNKLTYKNKYKLLLKVLNTNNINFIFEFVEIYKELIERNEKVIFDKLVEIGDIRAIIKYYCDIVKCYNIIYENKIIELLKEYNDVQSSIYLLSKYTLQNIENIAVLEKLILSSNDKLLIAKYIYFTNNKDLAINIFDNLMYFYLFCRDILKLDIKLEDFKYSFGINIDDTYINYVDDKIKKYSMNTLSLK